MKLRKFLGFVLALVMTFSSLNVGFAETVSEAEESILAVDDMVLSDTAVDVGGISVLSASSTVVAYPVEGGNIYFDESTGTITDCDTSVTSAVIPSKINGISVTSIKSYAFNGKTNLTSVTIPSSIKTIGNYAFSNCISISSLSIPSNVETIGSDAFNGCTGLKSLFIADGVKKIGSYAFYNCSNTNLTNLTIPGSVTDIGGYAFSGCIGLKTVTINASVNNSIGGCNLGSGVFSGDNNLKTVTLGNGIFKIDTYTFKGCKSLTGIIFPSSINLIGNYAFLDCISISSLSIPSNVETIGSDAFSGCTGLKYLSIADGVKEIGSYAFYNCSNSNFNSLTIPGSIQSIGSYAFCNCIGIKDITIKNSTNNGIGRCVIGSRAFQNDKALIKVVIEEGVTEIGAYAFSNCEKLEYIQLPKSLEKIGVTPFDGCDLVTLYVYQNSYAAEFAVKYNLKYKYISSASLTYTLTYDANGGSGAPSSQSFASGLYVTISSTKPTRSGYTFLGWSKSSSSTSASYFSGNSYTFSGNTILYAVWEKVSTQYIIIYNANGGSGAPSSQSFTSGSYVTISSTKPTRSGYTFLGWSKSSSSTSASFFSGSSYTFSGNTTLYAVWEKVSTQYIIIYNANGGSGAPSSQSFTSGSYVTISSTKPTRSGYTFLGWSKSSSSTSASYFSGSSYTFSGNTTLYAIWEKESSSAVEAPVITYVCNKPGKRTFTITSNVAGGTIYYEFRNYQHVTTDKFVYDGEFTISNSYSSIEAMVVKNGVSSEVTVLELPNIYPVYDTEAIDSNTTRIYSRIAANYLVDTSKIKMYYTTDGTVPAAVLSKEGSIASTDITVPCQFNCIYVYDNNGTKDIFGVYGLNFSAENKIVDKPVISAVKYGSGYLVTISCMTNNATIYYTDNGLDPGQTVTKEYKEPFYVNANTTIKAYAYLGGSYMDSDIAVKYISELSSSEPTTEDPPTADSININIDCPSTVIEGKEFDIKIQINNLADFKKCSYWVVLPNNIESIYEEFGSSNTAASIMTSSTNNAIVVEGGNYSVSTAGDMIIIHAKANKVGTAKIELTNVKFTDASGNTINVNVTGGNINILSSAYDTTVGGINDNALGDVNGDGKVNITDAVVVAKLSIGKIKDDSLYALSDINGDGKVNITDAVIIAKYSIGKIKNI